MGSRSIGRGLLRLFALFFMIALSFAIFGALLFVVLWIGLQMIPVK
jgi:hypothetical protein